MTTLFSKPKVRAAPPPAAPAPPAEPDTRELEKMEEARKRARRGARGRISTILTGGRGVGMAAPVMRKRLLGE